MALKLTTNDLSILTLIASGVSEESEGFKELLTPAAAEIAGYLTNPTAKHYDEDTVDLGDALKRQVPIERSYPTPSSDRYSESA